MKRILNTLLSNKRLARLWLGFFIRLHNYSYKKISGLVCVLNNGIHPKHKIINYHEFFTSHVSDQDSIIDIGCGNGANAYDIADKAKRVIGIDIEKSNITFAQAHFPRPNLTFITGDALTFSFNEQFDKIVLSNVLEHIRDRIPFLTNLHALSSIILLRVPMITRDWLAVYKKNLGYEYRLDATHEIEYTLEQLQAELTESQWTLSHYTIQYGELWGVVGAVHTSHNDQL